MSFLVSSSEVSARKSYEPHDAKTRFSEQGKLALSNDLSNSDSKAIGLLSAEKLASTHGGAVADLEAPPFFNMQIQEDYCIAVTGKELL